jgi:mannose/fructose-specific phosphotransferase system component IIA
MVGRPSFLRRPSSLANRAASPISSYNRRRLTGVELGLMARSSMCEDDGDDVVSEMNKSTAGDAASLKSYGSKSKDLPWCGCWGNGCF